MVLGKYRGLLGGYTMQWWRMSLLDVEQGSEVRGTVGRVDWADAAKAVSIILLVLWTLEGFGLYFNQMFILARMQLFFFVSGLFAWRVITSTDLETFLREKVGNLVYLYVLWATLLFVSVDLVAWAWWGREVEAWPQVALLWQPYVPTWFFYGLAIAFLVAWLCRTLPIALVAAVSLVAYWVAVATGDWMSIPVFERVVRYFPYFWLGLAMRPAIFALVERYWRFWPVPVALYLALSYFAISSPWNSFPPLPFVVTAIGIAGMLMFSAQLARLPLVARPLAIVGASTLYIYATQHVTLFYLLRVAGKAGLERSDITVPALVIIVAWGTIFGRWAARTQGLRWLFRAPWLGQPRSRAGRAATA
jgi:uncharacterized membrane protein YcfT